MDEQNELIQVAMNIIMNAGNARTKTDKALDYLLEFEIDEAKLLIKEAREDITKAHIAQTKIIQEEASGKRYDSCLLFTHAQDTLMTIMSEVNLSEKMILLFEAIEKKH